MDCEFADNDFDEIYAQYFEDMICRRTVAADPSGWAHSETEVDLDFRCETRSKSLANYLIDNRQLIARQKESLLALMSAWDRTPYQFGEVTIVPSISTASLAVLLLLRAHGIETVYFETPAYYVTIDQARAIGMRVTLVPTHAGNGYAVSPLLVAHEMHTPVAVWLTQPRYALGTNQDGGLLNHLVNAGVQRNVLVVDETADQLWPSALADVHCGDRVIKIRGFMKPLGLNALRLAFIIHSAQWRKDLQELQWLTGAALDQQSLDVASQIAEQDGLFSSLLAASRARVVSTRQRLISVLDSPSVALSPMTNGYLGTLNIHWTDPSQHSIRRAALLRFCREVRMPVTLGSAMLFAHDGTREHIRLNYFMPIRDLEYCIKAISRFMERPDHTSS